MTELSSGVVRIATIEDAPGVVSTFTAAFDNDPVWSWAFPDPHLRPAQYDVWWGIYVEGALRYPWVWTTPNYEAASVWIPPGGTELSPVVEEGLDSILSDLLGSGSEKVLRALDRFEAAHPREQPHYYLSLLGTNPDHRGRGLGMAVLADNLIQIDAEHRAAYLESTNPENNRRYERHGFVPRSNFAVSDDGPVVTTMWRDAR